MGHCHSVMHEFATKKEQRLYIFLGGGGTIPGPPSITYTDRTSCKGLPQQGAEQRKVVIRNMHKAHIIT